MTLDSCFDRLDLRGGSQVNPAHPSTVAQDVALSPSIRFAHSGGRAQSRHEATPSRRAQRSGEPSINTQLSNHSLRPRHRTGFTLLEVITTVAIIGILASIAIPGYLKTIERNYWRAAQDILQTIFSGEEVYLEGAATYFAPGDWRIIYLDDPNVGSNTPVTYTVTNVTPTTFSATASRGDGRCISIQVSPGLPGRTINFGGGAPGVAGCSAAWPQP